MVKHIVMWRLHEQAEGRTKQQNLQLLKEKLMSLKPKIKEIIDYQVGFNFEQSPAAFDVVLISEFTSKKDLDIYRHHPEHVKIAEFIGKIRSERAVVDFEI